MPEQPVTGISSALETRWRRIDELFHAALERPAHEREQFLRAACDGAADLLADVSALVHADGEAGGTSYEHWVAHAAAGLIGEAPPRDDVDAAGLVGRTISHYEIRSRLGAGGMGEVYLAHDLTLARSVAIKILPPAVAGDAGRLRRFVLEARAASSLSHPNVAAIHDLCEHEGLHFIVMEYIDGRTLDAVMHDGLLPLDRVLDIGIHVACALQEAHGRGITHRDIKPANVMVTPRGDVKVLDFGLAKLLPGGIGRSDAMEPEPTLLSTTPGLVMGTVHYMSPEQALAGSIDHRSDLFSLGVLLYQLVTGRLPFDAPSFTGTLDAILHREPDPVSRIRPEASGAFDRVLSRALAKSPAARYQHAQELGADLEALRRGAPPTGARPRRWSGSARRLLPPAAVAVAGACVAAVAFWPAGSGRVPMVVPFTSFPGNEGTPAFSPDGEMLAYSWDGPGGDNVDVYLHPVGGQPVRMTHDPGADMYPAFSPDGSQIAFVRNRTQLLVVDRAGGQERRIGTVGDPRVTFTPDGAGVVAGSNASPGASGSGLMLFPLGGGPPRTLTHPPAATTDIAPAYSPDGRQLAFQRIPTTAVSDIWIADASGQHPRRITFDDRNLEGPVWTQDGRSLVFASPRLGAGRLWRVSSASGTPEPLPDTGPGSTSPTIARTGERLAFVASLEDTNIWELPLDARGQPAGTARRTPASSSWLDGSPDVSRDGRWLTFSSNRTGRDEIWVSAVDTVEARQVTDFSRVPASAVGSPRWSPDGTRIAFDARVRGNADIYLVPAAGGEVRRLTTDPSADVVPSWSNDGSWIYFTSRRGGRPEIWRMPADGSAAQQVTTRGGFGAQESVDGTLLLYSKERANSPLWKRPKDGGAEEPVLVDRDGRAYVPMVFSFWRPTPSGIVFLEERTGTQPGAARQHLLQSFDTATRRVTVLATLTARPSTHAGGLAISPDGRRVLFTQTDQQRSDINLLAPYR